MKEETVKIKVLDFLNKNGEVVGFIDEKVVQDINENSWKSGSQSMNRSYKARKQVRISDEEIRAKILHYKDLVDKGILQMVEHNVLMEDGGLYQNCLIITQDRVEAPIDNSLLFNISRFDEVSLFLLNIGTIFRIKTDDIYNVESKKTCRKIEI